MLQISELVSCKVLAVPAPSHSISKHAGMVHLQKNAAPSIENISSNLERQSEVAPQGPGDDQTPKIARLQPAGAPGNQGPPPVFSWTLWL
jgi:hypothetical protein